MLITASEGQGFRYEVMGQEDGFLVRTRDVDTGEVDEGESKVFRTAAVAFAYAELLAAFNRYAAACIASDNVAETLLAELSAQQALYRDLSQRLGDEGFAAQVLVAWSERSAAQNRRRLH